MESRSERVLAIKKLLWETYQKKVMSPATATSEKLTPFEIAVSTTFDKASSVFIQGFSTETLTMVRTRFILEWFKSYASDYRFRLFDHQQQLLKAGLFDAYKNKTRYGQWKTEQVESFSKLESFLFNRVFKLTRYPYLF
jgi:hypothetical protein